MSRHLETHLRHDLAVGPLPPSLPQLLEQYATAETQSLPTIGRLRAAVKMCCRQILLNAVSLQGLGERIRTIHAIFDNQPRFRGQTLRQIDALDFHIELSAIRVLAHLGRHHLPEDDAAADYNEYSDSFRAQFGHLFTALPGRQTDSAEAAPL